MSSCVLCVCCTKWTQGAIHHPLIPKTDATYAQELLLHATQLFEFGDKHQGIGSHDFYGSSGYKDELAFAAAWLHKVSALCFVGVYVCGIVSGCVCVCEGGGEVAI